MLFEVDTMGSKSYSPLTRKRPVRSGAWGQMEREGRSTRSTPGDPAQVGSKKESL